MKNAGLQELRVFNGRTIIIITDKSQMEKCIIEPVRTTTPGTF